MNLKKNNGFVGTDVSVAVVILLILIPIITGMIYNISKSNNNIKRKSQAINIAINAIESAKGIGKDSLNIETWNNEIKKIFQNNINGQYILEFDSVQYKIELKIINNNNTKTANVTVTYRLGGNEKEIDLSTLITQ